MTQTLKKISDFKNSPSTFYCGIDIHKQQITLAVYGKDPSNFEFIKTDVFKTDPASLAEMWSFIFPYCPKGFVMEATGIFHHIIADFLAQKRRELDLDFEIYIVNPADVAGIPGQQQRNDELDAVQMVKFYAAGLLKNGRALNPLLEDLKALFRMSHRIEQDRTALKNRIIKTLDRAGFRPKAFNLNAEWVCETLLGLSNCKETIGSFLKSCFVSDSPLLKFKTYITRAYEKWQPFETIQLSSTQRALIRQDLYELDLKTSRRVLLKVEVEKLLQASPVLCNMASNLATLPGITKYSAVWILAELGGINRFRNIGAFLTYCGCVPRSEISDKVTYSTHLTRHSNKYLRCIFYQAACVLNYVLKTECSLKEYARHAMMIKSTQIKLANCKIMAKLARLSYGILKNGHPYDMNLGQDHRKGEAIRGNGRFSVLEQKEIRRTKRLLGRLMTVKGLSHVSCDIDRLIVSLEETVKKKDLEGRGE